MLMLPVLFLRAVGHVMSSLFYPLFTFLLLALVIAYWAVTAVYPFALSDVTEGVQLGFVPGLHSFRPGSVQKKMSTKK